MAKRPAAGQTKTRLCPPLTPARAAGLYACFLRDTLDLAGRVQGVQPVIAYLPAGQQDYFRRLAPGFDLALQEGSDLGARLENVIRRYLEAGCQQVVAMDSDSPTLPLKHLQGAFEALSSEVDVVVGPCEDGGYYLIGFKRPAPRLLRAARMGTSQLTADTLALAQQAGLSVHLLPTWYDIDDASTLSRLRRELQAAPLDVAPHTRRFLGRLPDSTLRLA
jgi:hypothetical protein